MIHVEHKGNYMRLSAEFVSGILATERGLIEGPVLSADIAPRKEKHASGPVKAKATDTRRMRK